MASLNSAVSPAANSVSSPSTQYVREVVDVPLTATGNTTLYTVPAGKILVVDETYFLGKTAITGATKIATVKVGTSGGSFAELLGSTGGVFTVDTATSLLAVGARIKGTDWVAPANVAASRVCKFAAGSVIAVNVSGATPPGAGAITVELEGVLRDA